jgi:hypothetical protein
MSAGLLDTEDTLLSSCVSIVLGFALVVSVTSFRDVRDSYFSTISLHQSLIRLTDGVNLAIPNTRPTSLGVNRITQEFL